MILSENDHVVETLASRTPARFLTDRIQIRGFRRDDDNVDTRTLSDRGKPLPELAVVVADQMSRPFAPGSGFP